MEYCTVLNRKSAGMYFNVGCTYSPDGFIIDLMFISHTDFHIQTLYLREDSILQ